MERPSSLLQLDLAARALGQIEDLEEPLNEASRQAQRLLRCEHAALLFVDPERGDLAVRAAANAQ